MKINRIFPFLIIHINPKMRSVHPDRKKAVPFKLMSNVEGVPTLELFYYSVKSFLDEIRKKNRSIYFKKIPEYFREKYSRKFNDGFYESMRYSFFDIVNDGFRIRSYIDGECSVKIEDYSTYNAMVKNFRENIIL